MYVCFPLLLSIDEDPSADSCPINPEDCHGVSIRVGAADIYIYIQECLVSNSKRLLFWLIYSVIQNYLLQQLYSTSFFQ